MRTLSIDEIRSLCQAMDTTSSAQSEEAWSKLRELGPAVVPYLAEAYGQMRKWQGRVACVFYLMKYARTHEAAFQIGLVALNDRATLVRYRACMLLAKSQRFDANGPLREVLNHPDQRTSEDAAAAIAAIENKNPNCFIDRGGTGRIILSDDGSEVVQEKTASEAIKPWWKIW